MLNSIKGVIFDFGGTLDTGGDHWSRVIYDKYLEAGLNISYENFREAYIAAERRMAVNVGEKDTFRNVLLTKMHLQLGYLAQTGLVGGAEADDYSEKIASACYEHAQCHIEQSRAMIEWLSASVPVAVVSNFYGNLSVVLSEFGLMSYLKGCIDSNRAGISKPDPEIFRLGCELLGVSPEEVLVVGDSLEKDIMPAASIGCRTLHIKGRPW